jgi:hypothetical protein
MPKTLPVLFWHSRQLQAPTEPGLPFTVTRSWPQEQAAVRFMSVLPGDFA